MALYNRCDNIVSSDTGKSKRYLTYPLDMEQNYALDTDCMHLEAEALAGSYRKITIV